MKLIELLQETEGFVSGQEIARRMGISRNAVWKAVGRAREEGYEIEAVPRRGYRLREDLMAFGPASLRANLHTKWLGQGKNLIFYREVGSTNDEVKRLAGKGAPEGLLIAADHQSAGRGRRGRAWQSPPGTSAAISCLLRPSILPEQAPMITLVMALAASDAIRSVTGLETGIKWPNDIVIHRKKAVGILTEMSAEPAFIHYVVTGIGININTEEFPPELRETATSLRLECGEKVSRAKVAGEVVNRFEALYEDFLTAGDLSGLREKYNSVCVNVGRRLRVLDPAGEYSAEGIGINSRGELLVETDSKELKNIYAGEVSVRGIYGYAE